MSTSEDEDDVSLFLKVLTLVLSMPAMIWSGYVFTILWRWFVVPVLHAPELGLLQAMGLSLTVAYLTIRTEPKDFEPESSEARVRLLFSWFSKPALVLGFGWLYHLFL